MNQLKIILVDDDPIYTDLLKVYISKSLDESISLIIFNDPKIALDAILEDPDHIAVIIVDYQMPNLDGLEFISSLQSEKSNTQILILTGSIDTKLASLLPQYQIYDLLEKELKPKDIVNTILSAYEYYLHNIDKEDRIKRISRKLKINQHQKPDSNFIFHGIIGNSPQIQKIKKQILKIAPTDVTCLIIGESGTGKELVAKAIQAESPRNTKTYNIINCAAIPSELVESEFFGYRKGSFTGANVDKIGMIEASNDGTLFLDEVTEIPYSLQAKLLRFLQEGTIQTLGAQKEKKLNVRVIAATNRIMKEAIQEKQFREDLYYRLGVIEIELPPLRERKEDIPLLVESFINEFCEKNNKSFIEMSEDILPLLISYSWPGNIRELRNVIQRMILLSENGKIDLSHLPNEISRITTENITILDDNKSVMNGISMKDVEKQSIENALTKTKGNKEKASQILGISRATIFRKIKEYGIKD